MPVNRLMKFVELCKGCGVTISPSESVAFANDIANVALDNKLLMEEATVACLAKDNESEVIVRKLFRLFFTARPEEKQEEEPDVDHADSQFALALQEALESGEFHFDEEMSKPTPGDTDMPTEQTQRQLNMPPPRIQAAPTHHPQTLDQKELERELAQFVYNNLSGRELERIVELLESLNAMQNATHTTQDEDAITERTSERAEESPTDTGIAEAQQNEQEPSPKEQADEQLEDENTGDAEMLAEEQQDEQAGTPAEQGEGDEGDAPSFQPQQGGDGMGAGEPEGRGNRGGIGTHGNPAQQRGGTRNMDNSGIPRFNMPLSLEAAQTLVAAFLHELVLDNAAPPLGGRLARLMNPEQGVSFAQQHQMALDLWVPTEQERERLLRSLEYVVGRLLLQDCITPEKFAEYSALFDEFMKAQITIAGAGAETHLKDVGVLATLLSQYRAKSPLLRVIVSRLTAAMHRLLSRRMPIYTKSSGGKLDVRKTIRQSLQYGGIPMEFIYREKVLWEDIVLALDTSGSQVWWAVSAMLFARAFAKTAKRLRIYSFTSDVEDVTKYVPYPEKFVEHLDNFAGYSNYETSFQQLLSTTPISARTTLIIVGDCRDYQGSWRRKSHEKYGQRIGPHSAKLMGKLKARSHKVIVLNPEEKAKWGVGDSAVLDYEHTGAIVKYVASPLDLAEQLMNV